MTAKKKSPIVCRFSPPSLTKKQVRQRFTDAMDMARRFGKMAAKWQEILEKMGPDMVLTFNLKIVQAKKKKPASR